MIAALAFLRSPVTKYVALALAVMAGVAWIQKGAADKATMVAEAQCQETFTERVAVEVTRQTQVAETVLEEARERAVLSENEVAELQERADELLSQLREQGASGTCPLDADTVRRLRDIN